MKKGIKSIHKKQKYTERWTNYTQLFDCFFFVWERGREKGGDDERLKKKEMEVKEEKERVSELVLWWVVFGERERVRLLIGKYSEM